MDLVEKISTELSEAMRSGDTDRTAVLRLLKNSLKNEQIKIGHDLSEDEAFKVLKREAKQRRDSIEAYEAGERLDLAAAEQIELGVIEAYLPPTMEADELARLVDVAMAETGASSVSQMGQVIAKVISLSEGRADGAEVSQAVRQRLE